MYVRTAPLFSRHGGYVTAAFEVRNRHRHQFPVMISIDDAVIDGDDGHPTHPRTRPPVFAMLFEQTFCCGFRWYHT